MSLRAISFKTIPAKLTGCGGDESGYKKNRLGNFFNLKSENLYTAANFLASLFNVW